MIAIVSVNGLVSRIDDEMAAKSKSRSAAEDLQDFKSNSVVRRADDGSKSMEFVRSAGPQHQWLHEMLAKPVPMLDFAGDISLLELLEMISPYDTTTYGATAGVDGVDSRMTFSESRQRRTVTDHRETESGEVHHGDDAARSPVGDDRR